jgi:hypothetical protein
MKSSIKIDFADSGNGLQPVISIKLIPSEDPRDGLLKSFFEQLAGQSSWLRTQEGLSFDPNMRIISILPIKPSAFKQTIEEIQSRIDAYSVVTIPPLDPNQVAS